MRMMRVRQLQGDVNEVEEAELRRLEGGLQVRGDDAVNEAGCRTVRRTARLGGVAEHHEGVHGGVPEQRPPGRAAPAMRLVRGWCAHTQESGDDAAGAPSEGREREPARCWGDNRRGSG